jgi:hypothetical protein
MNTASNDLNNSRFLRLNARRQKTKMMQLQHDAGYPRRLKLLAMEVVVVLKAFVVTILPIVLPRTHMPASLLGNKSPGASQQQDNLISRSTSLSRNLFPGASQQQDHLISRNPSLSRGSSGSISTSSGKHVVSVNKSSVSNCLKSIARLLAALPAFLVKSMMTCVQVLQDQRKTALR